MTHTQKRKAMTNLDSVLKSRDITLLTEIHVVEAMIFPVVMWRQTIKKAKLSNCGAGENS